MKDYREIIESLKIGIVYADNAHIIQYMDQKAMDRFSKSGGASLIGRNLLDCHSEASAKKLLEYHQKMLENKLDEVSVRKGSKGKSFMTAVRNDQRELLGYMERFEQDLQHKDCSLKENLYQKSANLYDEFTALKRNDSEIEFYKTSIPSSASVLELGCGTGRIALELAKRGNNVVGVDLSEEMLKVLHGKIVSEFKSIQGNIKTILADLVNFKLNRKFDAILLPYRAFQMLLSDKFRDQCLQNIKEHLNPNGSIIIDIFNPDLESYKNWTSKTLDVDILHSKVMNATVKRTIVGEKHFEKQQIISFIYHFEITLKDDEVLRFEEPMRLSYLNPEQATAVFRRNGLKVSALYSDFAGSKVQENRKKELIFVLKGEN